MTQTLQIRLDLAARRCARAVLVLAAGTFVHAAWSSQVAGGSIGKVATVATPAPRPAPEPTSTGKTTSTTISGSGATRAASGPARAGSAAKR